MLPTVLQLLGIYIMYPTEQLYTLSHAQLESMAETPLEQALLYMLTEQQDHLLDVFGRESYDGSPLDCLDLQPELENRIESAIEEAKAPLELELARYKSFFSSVVDSFEWPAAEPDDDNLVQAINEDLGHADNLRELVKDLKGVGYMSHCDSFDYGVILHNHWDNIKDAYIE